MCGCDGDVCLFVGVGVGEVLVVVVFVPDLVGLLIPIDVDLEGDGVFAGTVDMCWENGTRSAMESVGDDGADVGVVSPGEPESRVEGGVGMEGGRVGIGRVGYWEGIWVWLAVGYWTVGSGSLDGIEEEEIEDGLSEGTGWACRGGRVR